MSPLGLDVRSNLRNDFAGRDADRRYYAKITVDAALDLRRHIIDGTVKRFEAGYVQVSFIQTHGLRNGESRKLSP